MMSILQRLSKLPQNLYCFTNIQRYPKRNESFLSASRQSSLLKTIFKASLVGISIGFPVGIIITTGYSWYINKKAAKTYHLEGKEKKIKVLQEKPSVPVSREVVSPMDSTELKLTLFQYQTCPFCCKVRVFLDYYGISYDIVEVDPVLRKEISWSSYKKVPILLAQIDSGYQPLNDSSMIVSLLASYLKDRSQKINDLVEYYPSIAMHDENQKLKYEIMNKYFLMYKENLISDENINEVIEERKWRQWVDDEFVHTLSPNVYRTLSEAYKTFNWFSEVGKWEEYFPMWERLIIINIGAIAMWFISKRLKKRHNLKDDVRQSLYDEINKWLYAIKKHGGTFMGGKKPNLSDLAVYGILKSIEGCSAFKDALENTKLCTWYDAMTKEVETHSGSKYLMAK
ncbi:prostaglandin E synthase 2 isoform X1 [Apis mellifera carnica]|uniref:Prostaglandin E synthase 2 isoform X1 n=1 Tax=Apis mellifera TaxID=7460 RepID=A0A7M7MPB1_APIME|nr:prostaglandin E synthase 2 isoform X1 [Apis mellifera]KAG9430370.1 prostaglandin E synthase 2 isoform X1 [Apis mellifera carnica]|eukprot:XP_026298925.1 prostaglandin E synthase 2 isoform X1 [Apis mellifera]